MRCMACNKKMDERESFSKEGYVEDLCTLCRGVAEYAASDTSPMLQPTGNEAMTGLHPDWEMYADLDLPIPDNTGATIDE